MRCGAYPESKAEAEREPLALKSLDVRIGRLPFASPSARHQHLMDQVLVLAHPGGAFRRAAAGTARKSACQ